MQNQGRICPRGASYYDWKEGDTLNSVARVHGTTAHAIQILNEGVVPRVASDLAKNLIF